MCQRDEIEEAFQRLSVQCTYARDTDDLRLAERLIDNLEGIKHILPDRVGNYNLERKLPKRPNTVTWPEVKRYFCLFEDELKNWAKAEKAEAEKGTLKKAVSFLGHIIGIALSHFKNESS